MGALWMMREAKEADLVVALSTSLAGEFADAVVHNAAERSLTKQSLGTVCINLQQTPLDGIMTLRIFGKSDEIMSELLKELRLYHNSIAPLIRTASNAALVPYDASGRRVTSGGTWMWLNLANGERVRITASHNLLGSQQPMFARMGKESEPVGIVVECDENHHASSWSLREERCSTWALGGWTVQLAVPSRYCLWSMRSQHSRKMTK